MSETFNVLSLKEMKLQAISSAAGGATGEEPEEEEKMATMAKAVMQAAQKKVVSQVSSSGHGTGTLQSVRAFVVTVLKKLLEVVSATYFGLQVQKKAFIENTVPLIISLKSLLEQKRSPVLRDLMAYLQVRHLKCFK